ncbi:MAG: alpha/beta hydrolase [Candidatus Dormibacteraeota bacterium]|nr:alpha/beta hydrolase [Candidatus Dormibacteraeota bacterium]
MKPRRDAETCPIEHWDRTAARFTSGAGDAPVQWRSWGTGRPVLLLHGGGGSWTHWIRNLEVLRRRFQVIAPDLPGFGDSPLPPGLASAEDMAAVMRSALSQALPPSGPFDIVGFSFGGIIAGLIAAGEGTRVGTVVLVGPGGLGLDLRPAATVQRVGPDATPEEVRAADRHNLAGLLIADPDEIDDLALCVFRRNVERTRFNLGGIPATDVLARALPAVTANVVVVYGEHDQFARGDLDPREQVLRAARPGLRFEVVEGAGHWVPFEAAEVFNSRIFDWLSPAS